MVTTEINLDFSERPDNLADVPVNRIATVDSASGAVANLLYARNVVQVNLGNEMYPTPALAEQFGVSQAQLSEIFWSGVSVDYRQLQATGARVRAILEAGSEVHITSPSGTDLRARIDDSMIYVSDGVVSPGERERGGAARLVWLPAGEVYLAPMDGTAHGKVVVDRHFFRGEEIRGLTLSFENGRLTSMDAASDFADFAQQYDIASPGKEAFGFIDVGINANVQIPSGSRMMAWMAAGMVTVGFGSNVWAGGHNNVPYGTNTHLPGSTLKVDGQVVVDGGVLVIGSLPPFPCIIEVAVPGPRAPPWYPSNVLQGKGLGGFWGVLVFPLTDRTRPARHAETGRFVLLTPFASGPGVVPWDASHSGGLRACGASCAARVPVGPWLSPFVNAVEYRGPLCGPEPRQRHRSPLIMRGS
jgi:leucyl aminopeptidase (aminopeptidase T)